MASNDGKQKKNSNIRPAIFAAAGMYELYITGRLIQATVRGEIGLPTTTAVLLIALMAVLGIGIVIYSWHIYLTDKRAAERDEKAKSEKLLQDAGADKTDLRITADAPQDHESGKEEE